MKKAISLWTMILIATLITGFVIYSIFISLDSQKSEKIRDAKLSDISSKNESDTPGFLSDQNAEYLEGLQMSDRSGSGSSLDLSHKSQMDLNEIAIYNGIISEISVSPSIVSYDYNHDGVVDVKKTILFFNIG
jgi:hypothetical protein